MKSPFKFLDSYTLEDRSIFSGCKVYCYEFQEYALNSISPLQGLKEFRYQHWTLSNAWIFCAFSAMNA
jgi:hypothetical protein